MREAGREPGPSAKFGKGISGSSEGSLLGSASTGILFYFN